MANEVNEAREVQGSNTTQQVANVAEAGTEAAGVVKANSKSGNKNAARAAEVAKNYGVNKVWCTSDGAYWATTAEKKKRLPTSRGGIEEYSFTSKK